MPVTARALLVAVVALTCCFAPVHASATESVSSTPEGEGRVFTDGRLRPGHFETIRVSGFPGKGMIEVTFFPTAICESRCAAIPHPGGKTNARGSAKFRVRVPGTFLDHRNKHAYFRNGERIEFEVLWYGPGHTFDTASANPAPILVRAHGHGRE